MAHAKGMFRKVDLVTSIMVYYERVAVRGISKIHEPLQLKDLDFQSLFCGQTKTPLTGCFCFLVAHDALTSGAKCDDLFGQKEEDVMSRSYLYIVDDDDIWRKSLTRWVQNAASAQEETLEPFPKERILAFGTYQGALDDVTARASAAPPDTLFCLVTDGSLDGSKNGLQMIRAFSEVLNLRLCHVIMQSGEERYRSGAEALGASFLHKPFDFEDLQEALAPFWGLLSH